MSEQSKRFIVAAVLLFVSLGLGWTGCAASRGVRSGDDERPPIVIYEASLHFAHGYGWTDQGERRVWRPAQPDGKHVKHYDVEVTSNDADAGCGAMRGKDITIVYENRTFSLTTKKHPTENKDEPELTSPDPLTIDGSGLILNLASAGKIEKVTVGNRTCDVSTKPGIRLSARPKKED